MLCFLCHILSLLHFPTIRTPSPGRSSIAQYLSKNPIFSQIEIQDIIRDFPRFEREGSVNVNCLLRRHSFVHYWCKNSWSHVPETLLSSDHHVLFRFVSSRISLRILVFCTSRSPDSTMTNVLTHRHLPFYSLQLVRVFLQKSFQGTNPNDFI